MILYSLSDLNDAKQEAKQTLSQTSPEWWNL